MLRLCRGRCRPAGRGGLRPRADASGGGSDPARSAAGGPSVATTDSSGQGGAGVFVSGSGARTSGDALASGERWRKQWRRRAGCCRPNRAAHGSCSCRSGSHSVGSPGPTPKRTDAAAGADRKSGSVDRIYSQRSSRTSRATACRGGLSGTSCQPRNFFRYGLGSASGGSGPPRSAADAGSRRCGPARISTGSRISCCRYDACDRNDGYCSCHFSIATSAGAPSCCRFFLCSNRCHSRSRSGAGRSASRYRQSDSLPGGPGIVGTGSSCRGSRGGQSCSGFVQFWT